jgi:hypothetical protein
MDLQTSVAEGGLSDPTDKAPFARGSLNAGLKSFASILLCSNIQHLVLLVGAR